MNRNSLNRWVAVNTVILTILLPATLVSFQNCAPQSFSMSSEDSNTGTGGPSNPPPDPGSTLALVDQIIQTSFNTPVNWTAQYTGDRTGFTYSLNFSSNQSTLNIANVGTVEVVDASAWTLKFTPIFGYRGETVIWVYARNGTGEVKQAQVTLRVGNSVNLLAPALAVRGTGCITCHAEVHSNLVTDFGYGGDGNGRNYYFGGMAPATFAWNDGMVYGDQDAFYHYSDGSTGVGAWYTLNLVKVSASQGQKVYVPSAPLPTGPANETGASSLKGYVQHRLNASMYADSHLATAVEKNSVYIGAPTANRLKTVFDWQSADATKKWKYIVDAGGAALSGLNNGSGGPTNGSYFTNTGNVVCEGDLMLDGTVYLNNLKLQSRTGCRLYVTGTVFIYGPITYLTGTGDYSKRNLQITSSKAIMMGLGSLWKNATPNYDGAHDMNHCEYGGGNDSGYWGYFNLRSYWTQGMTPSQVTEYNNAISDSAKYRLTYFWGLPAFFFRSDIRTGEAISQDIYNEMMSTIGQQLDAACRPEGRGVAYERLLLNAPLVESRYAGGFKGSIIAEIGLMSLGLASNQSRFKFEFDSVFQNVDVFPLLQDQDFLHVQ